MQEKSSDPGKEPDAWSNRDAGADKTEAESKPQSGRPPARPPYEQYLRVSKVSK
jgi:hypothetical protein